jgi:uncharacterized protein YndB with AHSA1/START domain
MIIYILIALAVIVAGLVVLVAMQPTDFRITRSATIPAPPSVVFEEVNDFHKWEAWSPWAKMDPAATNTFAGPPSGVGAIYTWAGNNKVGEGKMTLLESRPSQLIRIQLEFLKPFQATNIAEFTFAPAGNGTLVTWSMTGKNNFMSKAFVLLMNCDKMVGGQFEKGLQNLSEVTGTAVTANP